MAKAKQGTKSAGRSKIGATGKFSRSTDGAAVSTSASTARADRKSTTQGRAAVKKTSTRSGQALEPAELVRVARPERGVDQVARPIRATESQVRVARLSPIERDTLRELDELSAGGQELVVIGAGERRVSLTHPLLEAMAALSKVFEALDRRSSVTVVADDDRVELSSQEAADLLNVSRPHVVKLARGGSLTHHRVGNRHRFVLADVLDYRDQMRVVREEALAELAPPDGYTAADF